MLLGFKFDLASVIAENGSSARFVGGGSARYAEELDLRTLLMYVEIVASLASKSVGPGARANLDEFTYTTSNAICAVGGARRGKALCIINPAEPSMIMRSASSGSSPNRQSRTASFHPTVPVAIRRGEAD